jgi:L-aminopeptidase/D-esterase-like protein
VDSNPDLFVVYHVAFKQEKDISSYSSGYGGGYGAYGWRYGGGWGSTSTTTQVRTIVIGTMVIDLADAKAGELAWRGIGTKEVDTQAKPEKRQEHRQCREEDFQELSAEAETELVTAGTEGRT